MDYNRFFSQIILTSRAGPYKESGLRSPHTFICNEIVYQCHLSHVQPYKIKQISIIIFYPCILHQTYFSFFCLSKYEYDKQKLISQYILKSSSEYIVKIYYNYIHFHFLNSHVLNVFLIVQRYTVPIQDVTKSNQKGFTET